MSKMWQNIDSIDIMQPIVLNYSDKLIDNYNIESCGGHTNIFINTCDMQLLMSTNVFMMSTCISHHYKKIVTYVNCITDCIKLQKKERQGEKPH